MAAEASETLTIGLGGWAEWHSPDFEGTVRLRFETMPNGRLGVVETNIVARIAHSDAVRAIPIRRIEALANTELPALLLQGHLKAQAEAPIKLADVMQQQWSHITPPTEVVEHADGTYETLSGFRYWTPSEMHSGVAYYFAGRPPDRVSFQFGIDRSDLRLQIPAHTRKPDAFYAEVARVYGAAAAESGNPANLIADVNSISVSKVYQWAKEARRRGLLAPATRNARPISSPPSTISRPSVP